MTYDEVVLIVLAVLKRDFAIPERFLSNESQIMKDMKIDGDDADELIEVLEKELGIRIDIELGRYFHGESLFAGFRKKEDLSVGDLAKIALTSIG